MKRLTVVGAGILAGLAAVVLGAPASAQSGSISGTVSCTGTTCTATMTNNFAPGDKPVQGFYLRGSVQLSGLSITSDQAAGADCTTHQGPGGTPECFLNHQHYWTGGTTLSVTFSRASGVRTPADAFTVAVGVTLNQDSYVAQEWQLLIELAADPCVAYKAEESAELDALTLELALARANFAQAEVFYQLASDSVRTSGHGGMFAYFFLQAVEDDVVAAVHWLDEVHADILDETSDVAGAAKGECSEPDDEGHPGVTFTIGPTLSAANCDNQVLALAQAKGKAEVLSGLAAGYAKTKLAPGYAGVSRAVARVKATLAGPKTKPAAKAKLRLALARIAKANAIVGPVVKRLAGLPAQAKAAATDQAAAQAALDTCQKG